MTRTTKDRRNQRKGLVLAIILHSAVLALCIYPFLTSETPEPQSYETVVEFDFTEQSAAAANAEKRVRNNVTREITERKAAPKNPAAPALPSRPAPPILNAPSPLPPVVDVPAPPVPDPEPEPVLTPDPTPAPVVVDVPAPDPGPPASTKDKDGDANASGDATGSPEKGDGATVSDEGSGKSPIGSALEGDGILVRQVVYRPSLDEVIKQNGSVVLNICINQRGRVIGVKWNEERSSITDTDLVRLAIEKAQEYRFKADYSAPSRECGALSIHIKGL